MRTGRFPLGENKLKSLGFGFFIFPETCQFAGTN